MSGRCLGSISVALSFENVSDIYISDGTRESIEKWLAAYLYK